MDAEDKRIRVEWLEMDSEDLHAEMLVSALGDKAKAESVKRRAVEKVTGRPVPDGVTPFAAWLSWLCEINGLPDVRPVPSELADALSCGGATRFLWWLA